MRYNRNLTILPNEVIESMWERLNAYEPLIEAYGGWCNCKWCGLKPRVWVFNNGCYATCLCFDVYDTKPARAESVMSYYSRCGGSMGGYDWDMLRRNWNMWVKTGIMHNRLEAGRW